MKVIKMFEGTYSRKGAKVRFTISEEGARERGLIDDDSRRGVTVVGSERRMPIGCRRVGIERFEAVDDV